MSGNNGRACVAEFAARLNPAYVIGAGVVLGIVVARKGHTIFRARDRQAASVMKNMKPVRSATPDLFGARTPAGFLYQPDFVSPAEERELRERCKSLPFRPFEFHGFTGKRRVVSFGWRYDFNGGGLQEVEPIPSYLLPLRERAASLAEREAADLEQVLITEYAPGAAIGWHKDRGVFGRVVGTSLVSDCIFRFRRQVAGRWERMSLTVCARSAYVLAGPARTEWQHSIAPVESLRYSITFRTRADAALDR
jgi:alkylated DNA repair dioxygenase AlkB